eukprot:Hpha_TRINITY_DN11818_c0_g1::TRINITY_DN11818_c0_g1_i1::g.1833::m.1833
MKVRELHPAPIFDLPLLAEALGQLGKSAEHGRQIQAHVLRSPDTGYRNIKGNELAGTVVEMLEHDFARLTSRVVEKRTSTDGTIKLMICLQDGYEVEAVIIPMAQGYSTVCVSSQVGCAMGCTFCATGTMGLKANLTAGEIVEQVVHAREAAGAQKVRNVVFMGMGEPLHNLDAVLAACRSLTDPRLFGMPRHGVTVSTVGVVPGILRVAREASWLRLALSLHSPAQDEREAIVPSGKKYTLTDILAAIDEYLGSVEGQQIMIEFCVLRGKNDTPAVARQIGSLMGSRRAIVNLIPYNATSVEEEYQEPTQEAVIAMRSVLIEEFGLLTTIRQHHGRDIGGACGQLALQRTGGKVVDIEDAAGPSSRPTLRQRRRSPSPPRVAAAPVPSSGSSVRSRLVTVHTLFLLLCLAFVAERLWHVQWEAPAWS